MVTLFPNVTRWRTPSLEVDIDLPVTDVVNSSYLRVVGFHGLFGCNLVVYVAFGLRYSARVYPKKRILHVRKCELSHGTSISHPNILRNVLQRVCVVSKRKFSNATVWRGLIQVRDRKAFFKLSILEYLYDRWLFQACDK